MSPRWFVDFRMDRRLEAPEDLAAPNVEEVIHEIINDALIDFMVESLNAYDACSTIHCDGRVMVYHEEYRGTYY